ncbi:MAG: glutamate racemase [Nitrospirae bacterium GWD2_57_9]|nr:MAG: glutamate racemase [Nitrospirae bacterium GWD2_57_9]OGW48145.1 MAG: glutamate racemase [Nitrospirae bacterium GWC2_57_9]
MQKAIGIFDSGIGGLTVLKEIVAKLPQENIIYLGDTARVPYGIRSPETVTRYSFENTNFLLAQEIKMLVIACNTASAISLEAVKKEFPLPVIGVLEPGARAAVDATRTRRVGVIGTEATIGSGAYEKAIRRIAPEVVVHSHACPLFVSLAEEGWTDNDVAALVAEKYLAPFRGMDIDTLVLGCTHYPLLKQVIARVVGPGITLIDSAMETAKEVAQVLDRLKWKGNGQGAGARKFFVTDSPSRFEAIGKRFLGSISLAAEQVRVGGT